MKRKYPAPDNDYRSSKRQKLNKNNNYSYSSNNNNNSNRNGFDEYNNSISPSLSSSLEGDLEKIKRPSMSREIENELKETEEIRFQLVDIDYFIGYPPNETSRGQSRGHRAIIRLYGVTSTGQSVLCHSCGFCPYFYVETWNGFQEHRDEELFKNSLNHLMKNERGHKVQEYIVKVVTVKKQSVWGYHFGKNRSFLKVYTALPTLVPLARRLVSSSINIGGTKVCNLETYESNLTFILRFMIDRDIVGAGWVSVKKFNVVSSSKSSTCSLEIVSRWDNVFSLKDEEESIAPLRVLSFDIECMCSEGFPSATKERDQVIQISNVCYIYGQQNGDNDDDEDKYFHKNVFCLNSCSPIAGCKIYSFDTEKELLMGWRSFLAAIDPDILTGYNIINFDLPYLINRSQYLRIDGFEYLGRIRNLKTTMKDSQFSSKAYGSTKSKEITINGRVQMDLLPIIRRDHKLRSYSLNSVSYHFLKSQKEDVHYSIIGDLQNGTSETRRRLAVYCLKDSILPIKLMNKLQTLVNLIEMARVTGVPIMFLIRRGQQIKVLSQMYRAAKAKHLIIPYKTYDREKAQAINGETGGGVGYEGATVIEPVRGYYKSPITTLDFASLYPSIMIAHNLCYTTMIDGNDLRLINDTESYTRTESGDCFIKSSVQKGLLPEILEDLLSARKKVKKMMKTLKKEGNANSKLYAVYNGRQLALKISANSVYGFTGATVGSLPCLKISAAVTSFGRHMIHDTKQFVEKHYSVQNGFKCNAKVVYGDTDSVMIKFGENPSQVDIEEAMKLGQEAAELVTQRLFISPIRLEFEKVYLPYLLMNKKRYAGMLWTNTKKWDYMDAKGIETVRRDNCPLTKNVVQNVLNYVLIEANPHNATEYVKNIIYKLLQNRIDMSELIITKQLNKIEDYKVKAAHVELALRMKKRGDKIYKSGDRVSYVISRGSKKAKAYEKAEDPLYALNNGIVLDTEYYIHNQLEKPLTRIFEPILGIEGVKKLFNGSHTKSIKVSTSSVGAMMAFVVKKKTCVGCKCILRKNEKKNNLCSNCKSKESQLYIKQINILSKNENKFHKLWTQCQRCQGSLNQEVLCSNRDCPIFYKRTKVRKDLEEARKLLKEFSF